ncbi:MAG: hypothetical protein KAR51_04945, partial [Candidatus Aenigmarchaeota archaeon]|nr:hypothetical protein [Candidatus Aenigmarchaeota archaeon]
GGTRKLGELAPSSKDFVKMVPLVEIIAYSFGVLSVTSGKVVSVYDVITDAFGSEAEMWFAKDSNIESKLLSIGVDQGIIDNIIEIKRGNFCFSPAGFDGTYGKLKVGEKEDIFNVNIVSGHLGAQRTLF